MASKRLDEQAGEQWEPLAAQQLLMSRAILHYMLDDAAVCASLASDVCVSVHRRSPPLPGSQRMTVANAVSCVADYQLRQCIVIHHLYRSHFMI